MGFQTVVEWVAHGLEAVAVGVVCAGGVATTIGLAQGLINGKTFEPSGAVLRERLARCTLLALEFLVAADIIATIAAAPTPTRLLMLAGIILLRTFLSATLTMEVEGRWPWKAAPQVSPDTTATVPGRTP
jgi:uncharacterized membrane protein